MLAQDGLCRLEVPVALLNIVEELLGPEDRVDQRADEREEGTGGRAGDQERIRQALSRIIEGEDDQGAPDRHQRDQRERYEEVEDRVSESENGLFIPCSGGSQEESSEQVADPEEDEDDHRDHESNQGHHGQKLRAGLTIHPTILPHGPDKGPGRRVLRFSPAGRP